jgi:hypothetical protein
MLEMFKVTDYDSSIINAAAPWVMVERLRAESRSREILKYAVDTFSDVDLKLFTNLLVARALLSTHSLPRWAEVFDLYGVDSIVGEAKFHDADGVGRYLVVPGALVCKINYNDSDEFSLFNGINCLREKVGEGRDWIFDLSSIKQVSTGMLGYLVGLQSELKRADRRVILLWLSKGAVPDQFLESMKNRFSLLKKGAFLLST